MKPVHKNPRERAVGICFYVKWPITLKTVILKDSPCIKQATDEHMQYMMIFSFRIVVQGLFLYNV